MKINFAFVKGGTRPVGGFLKGWTKFPLSLWRAAKHCCALANASKILSAQFPKARGAFIVDFPIEKWKVTIKKVLFAFSNWSKNFSFRLCHSLYNLIQTEQLELCAPLAIRFLIGNYCMRWCCSSKGLSQDGAQAKFAENLRGSPVNKDLSNETICSQIHLTGQYILILVCKDFNNLMVQTFWKR